MCATLVNLKSPKYINNHPSGESPNLVTLSDYRARDPAEDKKLINRQKENKQIKIRHTYKRSYFACDAS
jgi:hypothetical protein